jgi:hypothetical protein
MGTVFGRKEKHRYHKSRKQNRQDSDELRLIQSVPAQIDDYNHDDTADTGRQSLCVGVVDNSFSLAEIAAQNHKAQKAEQQSGFGAAADPTALKREKSQNTRNNKGQQLNE